jgi:hypothetical protein
MTFLYLVSVPKRGLHLVDEMSFNKLYSGTNYEYCLIPTSCANELVSQLIGESDLASTDILLYDPKILGRYNIECPVTLTHNARF